MPASKAHTRPRWYLVPVRVLVLTFLFALLAFALGLLFGIIGVVLRGRIAGVHPDLTSAYRHIALPAAVTMSGVVLILVTVLEIRRYRQMKALRQIEEASR
jgi:prepilin signal peptidase PulO-like enzyme (type II secretory pathway)